MEKCIPESDPLFAPLFQHLDYISSGTCSVEELVKSLGQINKMFAESRHLWVEKLGDDFENFIETMMLFVFNQLIYFMNDLIATPEKLLGMKGPVPSAKRRPNLPRMTVERLEAWLLAHPDNPYPDATTKERLCQELDLSIRQLNDWFINARRRKLSK
jgi:hypothetical protein